MLIPQELQLSQDSFRLVVFLFSFIYSGFERTVLSIALLIRLYRLM